LDKKRKYFNFIKEDYFEGLRQSINSADHPIIWEVLSLIKRDILKDAMLDETPPEFSKKCLNILEPQLDRFVQRYFAKNILSKDAEDKEREDLNNFMKNALKFFSGWKKQIDLDLDNQDNELNDESLDSFIIEVKDKVKILRQLENIGITPMVVYPDLKGTIEHINNKYK
jgi:hypothetical protein